MSKKIALITLFIASSFFGMSQGFHMGVKFGTDIQKINGASFSEKFAFGYHLGGFAELKLSKSITIQPELYYSAVKLDTGSAFSQTYDSISLSKLKFGYLNIPLILSIKAGEKMAVQLGTRYGIIVDDNLSIKNNVESAFKKGDISVLAGIQFNFSKIKIYGRYQIGLSNLNDITGSTEKWKSQSIHIGLGLRII
jgi:hypothetical protein